MKLRITGKMKAALAYGPRDIRIEEIPIPRISSGEVLIRVKVCGVCAADFQKYIGARGTNIYQRGPIILGHEPSGVVAAVGENVERVKEGDRVAVDLLMRCGKCYLCLEGKGNLCIHPAPCPGAFCEYTKAPETNVFRIPKSLSFEEASFAEPLACCINGIEKLNLLPGQDVVILGAGPIGLMHLQLANLSGARVIVSDPIQERLDMAMKLGADEIINPLKEDPVEKVRKLTDGKGAHGVIIAVGNILAIEQGIRMARKGGTVVLFGAVWPPSKIQIDPNLIHYNEISIKGSESRTLDQFYRALKLIVEGKVRVRPLISKVLPLEDIEEGFKMIEKRSGFKILVRP